MIRRRKKLRDKQLDILHDHYKETFTRIRESEAARDRYFLWVGALYALLILEIGYPRVVGTLLGKLTILGGEFNLTALPLSPLLTASWVITLAVCLRYCRLTILVIRQYPYLHNLEETISPALGGGDLYRREGEAYQREYPLILDVAWMAYGILFPLIAMVGSSALWLWEWKRALHWRSACVDGLFAAMIIVVFEKGCTRNGEAGNAGSGGQL